MCTASNVKNETPEGAFAVMPDSSRPRPRGGTCDHPWRKKLRWTSGLVDRLIAILGKRVPEGYQDEAGFHFGVDPRAHKG
jgi:hypothetical protein